MARARGSYPRCRGFESPSRYEQTKRGIPKGIPLFVLFQVVDWDSALRRGSRGGEVAGCPGDIRLATTEAERRSNPPLAFPFGLATTEAERRSNPPLTLKKQASKPASDLRKIFFYWLKRDYDYMDKMEKCQLST